MYTVEHGDVSDLFCKLDLLQFVIGDNGFRGVAIAVFPEKVDVEFFGDALDHFIAVFQQSVHKGSGKPEQLLGCAKCLVRIVLELFAAQQIGQVRDLYQRMGVEQLVDGLVVIQDRIRQEGVSVVFSEESGTDIVMGRIKFLRLQIMEVFILAELRKGLGVLVGISGFHDELARIVQ